MKKRKKKSFDISDTFGIDLGFERNRDGSVKQDKNGNVRKERKITGYEKPTEWTPEIDDTFVFHEEATKVLLMGVDTKDRILLVGHTGTGKSTIVAQIAARLNYSLVRINFDSGVTRSDLVGEYVVKGESMEFQYGILAKAFQMPGTIILLDEWDSISSECSFVLQRPLERENSSLMILENGGELIPLHPDNLIVATANTIGQGDNTGLYTYGTSVQNYAQLNRFGLTIKMDYLNKDEEVLLLRKKFPDLKEVEANVFVKSINLVRDAYQNGEISVPLSPRDLINWVSKFCLIGDPMRAAKYCFLNRMLPEDSTVVEGILQRVVTTE